MVREEPRLTHLQGALLVLGTGVFFSFGGLAFRSTAEIDAWEYLVYRGLGMLAVACAVLLVRYRSKLLDVARGLQAQHVVAGVILGGMNILFIVSLEFATVAFVLVCQTLAPVFAAYFSWLAMREEPSRSVMVATVLSLVGVVIMVAGSFFDDLSVVGFIALLIPVGFGIYTTIIRSVERVDPSVPLVVAGLTLVVVAGGVVLSTDGFDAPGRDVLIGLFAGSVLLAMPLAVFNIAQRVVPAAETSILIMSEVVLAPIWVWVFVGERVSTSTIVGGAIIVIAVVQLTLNRAPRRGRRPITSRG